MNSSNFALSSNSVAFPRFLHVKQPKIQNRPSVHLLHFTFLFFSSDAFFWTLSKVFKNTVTLYGYTFFLHTLSYSSKELIRTVFWQSLPFRITMLTLPLWECIIFSTILGSVKQTSWSIILWIIFKIYFKEVAFFIFRSCISKSILSHRIPIVLACDNFNFQLFPGLKPHGLSSMQLLI